MVLKLEFQGTFCKEKAVLVAVYVETPKKRRLSSNNHHHDSHHHHHYHQHYLHQPKHGANGGRYNRRADLLDYSRHLRASAQSGPSTPVLHPKPVPSEPNNQPMTQIIGVGDKTKGSKVTRLPSCLGNLKLVIPSFLRSFQAKKERKKKKRTDDSTEIKMKSIMKSFQVQKKRGIPFKTTCSIAKS
ncbi:hypothetical protein ACSBR2_037641 [Camellia fascicularis]